MSGKDTLRRTDFARMLADAETGAFEVLLCYDTSRFARNVADAWTYREKLARCGVIVVFCADGLISGNVDTYELEGLKTVADAAYIRRLSRNVGNGYAQKWRLYRDPGGHAPLGFARVGERQLLAPVEGPDLDRVRRAFELYATGAWSDTNLADELGLAEAGLTEILTNPLYAGRAIRHKGKPDQEEKPASFEAPIDPALFERVQAIRERTPNRVHRGRRLARRRSYPLVHLMRCLDCGSASTATPTTGCRRIRHSRPPCVRRQATYRAEWYEEQLARSFDELRFDEVNIEQVLAAMRQFRPPAEPPDPDSLASARAELQAQLAAGSIGIEAFSRAWRRLERPEPAGGNTAGRGAASQGSRSSWPSSARSGVIRRCPIAFASKPSTNVRPLRCRGPELVAAHPQPNENAWLIGQALMNAGLLPTQLVMGMVGARGHVPPTRRCPARRQRAHPRGWPFRATCRCPGRGRTPGPRRAWRP